MIWALLAILGVPLWLIAAALLSLVVHRRNFKKNPDVFPCAVRDVGAPKWPRMPSYGLQVHDVLIVHNGAAFLRTDVLGVRSVDGLDLGEPPKKLSGAVGRLLTLDDGSQREVAASGADVDRLDALTS